MVSTKKERLKACDCCALKCLVWRSETQSVAEGWGLKKPSARACEKKKRKTQIITVKTYFYFALWSDSPEIARGCYLAS
jgi:hypothetical protein